MSFSPHRQPTSVIERSLVAPCMRERENGPELNAYNYLVAVLNANREALRLRRGRSLFAPSRVRGQRRATVRLCARRRNDTFYFNL